MVLPRVITSLLLVPLVLLVVWFGSIPYFLFVTGICIVGFWEYSLMAEEGGYPNHLVLGLIGGMLMLMSFYLDGVPGFGPIHRSPSVLFIFLLWSFVIFFREFFRSDKGHSFLRIITTIAGLVICFLFLGHMLLLRDLRIVSGEGYRFIGREMMFFLLLIIWAVDTGAWFVGRLIGRFPMAPQISPKKTWVGAIGGTIIACLVGWMFREIFLKNEFSRNEAVTYALLIAVAAQISDLTESLIKRSFGVKNSSELLPGHGGMLDRFDSFIFAAPFFYYVLIGTGRFQ